MHHKNPFFSIVIPTYNQADYIENAIRGAINQNFDSYEIIIVDDCSIDKTGEIVGKYSQDSKLRYIKNSQRLGRVGNYRNALLNYVKGTWVVYCDGDDYYVSNDLLSDAKKIIDLNPELVLFQGSEFKGIDVANAVIKHPKISQDTTILEGKEYIRNFFKISHFSHLTSVYKVEVARKIGFYSIDRLSSDINSILKLSTEGKVSLSKKTYGVWRQHENNVSRTANIREKIQNLDCIYDCYNYFLKKKIFSKKDAKVWKDTIVIASYKANISELLIHLKTKSNLSDLIYIFKYILKKDILLLANPNFYILLLKSIKNKIHLR